jgi:2-keto-3-deoxy-L-rhamnonate aldolase RhmA
MRSPRLTASMRCISVPRTCRPRWTFLGNTPHERIRAAFETVARAAKGHGKAMGVGGVRQDFEFQSWLLRLGVRYLTGGSDVGYILSASRADVKQLRELKL